MPWRLPDLDTLPKSPPRQVIEKAAKGETAPVAAAPVSGWQRLLPQTNKRRAYQTGLRFALLGRVHQAAKPADEAVQSFARAASLQTAAQRDAKNAARVAQVIR